MTGLDFGRYVFASPYVEWLCGGVIMTVVISAVSGLSAGALGLLVLRCGMSSRAPLRLARLAYVAVFRNLPLVPLLLFLTFGLPGLWRQMLGSPFPLGLELQLLIAGLALNTAAYVAEILSAGVEAVGSEQVNAARILGLRPRAIRWRVLYPQAVRIVAPALASRFVHNMKNSTMALVVPLPVERMEVVGQAGRIAGQTFSWAEPLIFAACVHLLLALGLGRLLNQWALREQRRTAATA